MINPLADQRLAQAHFDSPLCDSLSKKYFQGEQYSIPSSGLGRLCCALVTHENKLSQLRQFYPHQIAVQASVDTYNAYLFSLMLVTNPRPGSVPSCSPSLSPTASTTTAAEAPWHVTTLPPHSSLPQRIRQVLQDPSHLQTLCPRPGPPLRLLPGRHGPAPDEPDRDSLEDPRQPAQQAAPRRPRPDPLPERDQPVLLLTSRLLPHIIIYIYNHERNPTPEATLHLPPPSQPLPREIRQPVPALPPQRPRTPPRPSDPIQVIEQHPGPRQPHPQHQTSRPDDRKQEVLQNDRESAKCARHLRPST